MLLIVLQVGLTVALSSILYPPPLYLVVLLVVGVVLPVSGGVALLLVRRSGNRDGNLAVFIGLILIPASILILVFLLVFGAVFLGLFG